MGYSCTQDASYMLGVISRIFATKGNPNAQFPQTGRYEIST